MDHVGWTSWNTVMSHYHSPDDVTSAYGIDPIIRLKDFLRLTGIGRSTAYALMGSGALERPIRISERAIGWRASTVKAFIDSRMPNRGQS